MNRLKVGIYKGREAFVRLARVVGGLQSEGNHHSVSIYTRDSKQLWGLRNEETRDYFGLNEHSDEINEMFDRVEGHEVKDAEYACPAVRARELGWIPDNTGE